MVNKFYFSIWDKYIAGVPMLCSCLAHVLNIWENMFQEQGLFNIFIMEVIKLKYIEQMINLYVYHPASIMQ